MKRILVANVKGGTGKTTVTTNLAGLFAARRQRVALLDLDRQRSATRWRERRPKGFPPIGLWSKEDGRDALRELSPQWLIIDSPAGLHGDKLDDALAKVDLVLVPVGPSVFDMDSSVDFLEALAAQKAIRKGESMVALVANRVDPRTVASRELEAFFNAWDLPVLAQLHAAQVYAQCAASGLTLFDLPRSRAEPEIGHWPPIAAWLDRKLA